MPDQEERWTHLLVLGRSEDRDLSRAGRGNPKTRDVERRSHGAAIKAELDEAFEAQDEARDETTLSELRSLGVVITIEAAPGHQLKLESLERLSGHKKSPKRPQWMLLSATPASPTSPERVTVWVSDDYRKQFLRLFDQYINETTATGKPKNEPLIANMAQIQATTLSDLWQSDGAIPAHGTHWWEIWLRPTSEAIPLMRQYARQAGLQIAQSTIQFSDRHVAWVRSTRQELVALPFSSVPIAELRRPQFIDTIEDLDPEEQGEYAEDLAERLVLAAESAPAVCLLDTGVRRTHVLLEGSLAASDMHTVVGNSVGDRHGHGTLMAGLALLGPIDGALLGKHSIALTHRLESVKFRPDDLQPAHDPKAYGVVTAQAVSLPEIAAQRDRVFCCTITGSTDRADNPGEPTLWSASVDALAAGTGVGQSDGGIELLGPPELDAARLFIQSAGNVDQYQSDHRENCDLSLIADPGQAWNALTVGAHTELTDLPVHPDYEDWTVVAEAGDISPHSRTGVLTGSTWPIKPDICMEGGNVLTDGADTFETSHPLVSLRSTSRTTDNSIGSGNATSAAAAQAARLAAVTLSTYPDYWAETVRGLITHHAEWTPSMKAEIDAVSGKAARRILLQRYGWGVPDETALLSSSGQAVTMVVQDEFVPFAGPEFKMPHLRLHRLPWPTDVLTGLGDQDVELRVTLSYFIEPTASRRGWRGRYSYASHGLRFELQAPGEEVSDLIRRVNRASAGEGDGEAVSNPSSGADNWVVGPNQRHKGSLHQDIWRGYGAELARTGGALAVYPVGGWWKYNKRVDRVDLPVRYALIVSLRTKDEDVDIYTPVATALGVPVEAVAVEA